MLKERRLGWWLTPVIPAIQGNINRSIAVQAGLGIKVRPYFKNNESKTEQPGAGLKW
jgi:hypothetical protein